VTRRRTAFLAVVIMVCSVLGVSPALATPGPVNAPEYWFDSWRVSDLWSAGVRGQGITIGEIDTGVNAAVPQLHGKVLPGINLGRSGGDGRTDRDLDVFGHGTAMASIMVAGPGPFGITGLAPAAKILPVAVPLRGTTDFGADDRLPEAIRWATDHGADIINLSLGGDRSRGRDGVACPPDEQQAVFHALRAGVIVVAAVGNDGPSDNTIEEPGVCLGVVSVGAVDARGTVATFSSRQRYLTVSAPGVNVPSLSRVPGSAFAGNGTSQAAAIVSAVLALAWSAHRSLSGEQIVTRLLQTVAARRSRPSYGFGIVDAYRAVMARTPASESNPVYAAAAPFLAREMASEQAEPMPAAAGTGSIGEGGYAVGERPRLESPAVARGLTAVALGAILLFALGIIGARRSRRRPLPARVLAESPPRPSPYPRPPTP
jgi:subtilisin family serine protease